MRVAMYNIARFSYVQAYPVRRKSNTKTKSPPATVGMKNGTVFRLRGQTVVRMVKVMDRLFSSDKRLALFLVVIAHTRMT